MTDDEPSLRGVHDKQGNGARKAWVAAHSGTCWREHPGCALARARDLELAARDHHAGRARRFADAVARHERGGVTRLAHWHDLAADIAEARAALEERHGSVDPVARARGRASAARLRNAR